MGSVSSLVNSGSSVQEKHCQASDHKLGKKGLNQHHHPQHHHPQQHHQPRRAGGRSLLSEGLLNCGFGQGSSTEPKSLSHSRSGRSEDFFYIKVSSRVGGGGGDDWPDDWCVDSSEVLLFSSQLNFRGWSSSPDLDTFFSTSWSMEIFKCRMSFCASAIDNQ